MKAVQYCTGGRCQSLCVTVCVVERRKQVPVVTCRTPRSLINDHDDCYTLAVCTTLTTQ